MTQEGTGPTERDEPDGRADMTADGTRNDARFCFLMNDARRGRCAEDPNWTERAFPTAYGSIASVKMGARFEREKRVLHRCEGERAEAGRAHS